LSYARLKSRDCDDCGGLASEDGRFLSIRMFGIQMQRVGYDAGSDAIDEIWLSIHDYSPPHPLDPSESHLCDISSLSPRDPDNAPCA